MGFTHPKTLLVAAMTFAAAPADTIAQTYDKQIVLMNLSSPRGIAIDTNGDLYYTEVPQPGVADGLNTVSRKDNAGNVTVIGAGMPEPLNLAIRGSDILWTCRTAGVVYRYNPATNGIYTSGLASPSGIAAGPTGTIYITQVPTPGVPGSAGGTNTVDTLGAMGQAPVNISTGEPEPVDIAVDPNGNAYWTCRTAGVILRRDGATGEISLLLKNLEEPTGIDVDASGAIYFTEIPTPGLFGDMGGRNKVSRFDPATSTLSLISFGEPEPNDVTVTADGSSVYWTCTTAGVIIRADLVGPTPQVTSLVDAGPGDTAMFQLDAPGEAGSGYLAASSLGSGPIPVDSRFIALELDELLSGTLMDAGAPVHERLRRHPRRQRTRGRPARVADVSGDPGTRHPHRLRGARPVGVERYRSDQQHEHRDDRLTAFSPARSPLR